MLLGRSSLHLGQCSDVAGGVPVPAHEEEVQPSPLRSPQHSSLYA